MTADILMHFQTLKLKLQETLQKSYPHFNQSINEWKAQEITALQEALHQKVKGYVSEKWFYTHLKPIQNDKLPRIDMLDMLAQYVDYANWQEFLFQQKSLLPLEETNILPHKNSIKATKSVFALQYKVYAILILVATALFWAMNTKKNNLEFCFQDADTQKPITQNIEIIRLQAGESPQIQKVNKKGCLPLTISQTKLTLVVKAKYYKTDTITRSLTAGQASEIIMLKKDDYALLIHLISKIGTTETAQIQKQTQLQKMFDDEAQIFQINEDGLGIELYNKPEFIDKLSLPLSSLKNIEVIETQYDKGKIILLRFIQK